MPRPPNWDSLIDWRFITNYMLLGCDTPQWLIVDYAGPPAQDLLLLFLLPNLTDIAQAAFDPRTQRRRKPQRHGKKRLKISGFPDPSDVIGGKVRGYINPYNALDLKPFRVAFRLMNGYEAVAISAAVIDGVTDVAYENLLGIVSLSDATCYEFKRIQKLKNNVQLIGGTGPNVWPVGVTEVDFNNGFFEGSFGTQCDQPYCGNLQLTIFNQDNNDIVVTACLGGDSTTPKYRSRERTVPPGEVVTVEVSGDFEASEPCGFGAECHGAQGLILEGAFMGFSISDWPWPW